MLIDTHTHLDFSQFEKDLTSVIDRASQADVRYMLNISTDPASIVKTLKLTEKYENIYAAVGLHPHEADKINDDDIQLVRVKTEHPKVKALGEVGLDFYRDYADHDNQRKLFRAMIDIASEKKLPLVIHNRAASEETLRILKEKDHDSLTGVFHCFAGDADFADEALKMG
nr:TatD family hydrolase [FCB group bacterium]